MKNSGQIFFLGFFTGAFIAGFILTSREGTIKSPKKIEPQIELITDGKVIDSLYVYKQQ